MRPVGVSGAGRLLALRQTRSTRQAGNAAARYCIVAIAPSTVIVEDWIVCSCGAYQNVRRLNEIQRRGAREQPVRLSLPCSPLRRRAACSSATTLESASVVVSPSIRPSAMSRNSRRMILPLRVFGSSG